MPSSDQGRGPTGDGAVLAIDVGGTSVKGAVVTSDAIVRRACSTPTRVALDRGGHVPVVEVVEAFAMRLAAETEQLTGRAPRAVGIAAPGVVDEDSGIVHFSANVAWSEAPLRRRLGELLGVPATLLHDVRAAALGEARLGAAISSPDFLFVAIGTGIGGGLVLGGAPRPGRHRMAAEIGHLVVDPSGEPCGCGAVGCLETVASATAVAQRYLGRAQQDADAGAATDRVDAKEVLRRAQAGDAVALGVLAEAVEALALALVACQTILDIDLVVLGGGMAAAGEALTAPLGRALRHRCGFRRVPTVRQSALGSDAGVIGTAVAAWGLLGVQLRARPGRPGTVP